MRGLLALGLIAIAVAACSSAGASTPRPTVDPSLLYGAGQSDAPSSAPDAAPTQQKLGDVIDIQCSDVDCVNVSVDKATFSKLYKDPGNPHGNDVPAKGDLYLAYHVTYKATGPNASYGPADWAVYVADNVMDGLTSVVNGPKPELSVGSLPQGKTASGWIVQEIPATGKVVVAYQPDGPEIFEVVVRSK